METLVHPHSLKASIEIQFNWIEYLEYFASVKYIANGMVKIKSHIDRSKLKNMLLF